MIVIDGKDGSKFVISRKKLNDFLSTIGYPHKEYLEYTIRKRLGQDLYSFNDFLESKKIAEHYTNDRPEHLRFDFDVRGEDTGFDNNEKIFRLFNLPISMRYSGNDYYDTAYKEHFFIFHKGGVYLYKQIRNASPEVVGEYHGYGTVQIITELLTIFKINPIDEEITLVA